MAYKSRKARLRACLEIAIGASSLVQMVRFTTQICSSLLRFFGHANVVVRWKMLVTLTLFSRWIYSLKMEMFTKNALQVVKLSEALAKLALAKELCCRSPKS